jgi:hypothetical protein
VSYSGRSKRLRMEFDSYKSTEGVHVLEVKMKRRVCSMLLIARLREGCTASRATDKTPTARESREERSSSMSDESAMRDLFDRGERVWHEGPKKWTN